MQNVINIVRTCSDERLEPAGLSTLSSVCKHTLKLYSNKIKYIGKIKHTSVFITQS